MDLIERIKAKESKFSKGQRKLADYILKEYDKAAFLTASKLGKAARAISEWWSVMHMNWIMTVIHSFRKQ